MYKIEEEQLLSAKEFEVLELLHQGLSNPEIAIKMRITISTVKAHISHIIHKFGARNRVEVLLMIVGKKDIANKQVKEQIEKYI